MADWQPIETAPREQAVLVCEPRRVGAGSYLLVARSRDGKSWWSIPGVYNCYPTHWMPLPDPPRGEKVK